MRKNRTIGPRQQRTRKIQQGGRTLGNIVKLGAKLGASNLLKWKVRAGTKPLSSGIGTRLIDEGQGMLQISIDLEHLKLNKKI